MILVLCERSLLGEDLIVGEEEPMLVRPVVVRGVFMVGVLPVVVMV